MILQVKILISIGTYYAAFVINNSLYSKIGKTVLCEPFCHPCEIHVTQASLVKSIFDTKSVKDFFFTLFVGRDVECQLYTQMFNESFILWNTTRCKNVKNILARNDFIIPHKEVAKYLDMIGAEYITLPGDHGDNIIHNINIFSTFL